MEGLYIIDVSDPKKPSEVTHYNITTGSPSDICVSDKYAYITGNVFGFLVLDISDPLNPIDVGSCLPPVSGNGVDVSGIYAYVIDGDGGLSILKYKNITSPVISVNPNGKLATTWGYMKK